MRLQFFSFLAVASAALASGLDSRNDVAGTAVAAAGGEGGIPGASLGNSSEWKLSAWEQIHQTLHRYSLAIDFKNGPLFEKVFTPDAFANYTGPLSNMTGLSNITESLLHAVSLVDSQHQLGTTVIDHAGHGCSAANATTYFSATLFGKGNSTGKRLSMYGYYNDTMELLHDQGWRIKSRYLIFMGPSNGDMELVPSGSMIGN